MIIFIIIGSSRCTTLGKTRASPLQHTVGLCHCLAHLFIAKRDRFLAARCDCWTMLTSEWMSRLITEWMSRLITECQNRRLRGFGWDRGVGCDIVFLAVAVKIQMCPNISPVLRRQLAWIYRHSW